MFVPEMYSIVSERQDDQIWSGNLALGIHVQFYLTIIDQSSLGCISELIYHERKHTLVISSLTSCFIA